MQKAGVVFVCLFLCLADVIVTCLIFAPKFDIRHQILVGFYNYKFQQSLVDIWCLCLLRLSISLGGILGAIVNFQDSIPRLKYCLKFVCVVSVCSCMWINIKLLGLADHESNLHNPWVWAMLGYSVLASVSLFLQWFFLTKMHVQSTSVVVDAEETQPLLINESDNDGKTEKNKEKKDESEKIDRISIFRLMSYSRPDWMYISAAFFFLILSATGRIFLPYYTGSVINGIAIEKSQSKFSEALVMMSLITAGSAFSAGLRGMFMSTSMAKLSIRIRNILFASILKQEIGFFDNIRTGDLVSRLTSDTTTMSDTLCLNINIFLRSFITAVGVVVFMFKISWKMSLVTLTGLPIIIVVSNVYGEYYEKLSEQVQTSLAEANNIAEEACSTMRTVRSFANELGEIARYCKSLGVSYKLEVKLAQIYGGYIVSNELFELALTVGTLYYGGHLVITGQLSGGSLVSFILYQIQLGESLDSIANVYTGLMQSLGASHKVFEYIDRKPKLSHSREGKQPDKLNGKIEFRNVYFSYPCRKETVVLKNISFCVEPGEVIALVGPSGGGKSSIVNLLQHFYQPQSGEVLLDGICIKDYSHDYLHRKVSLVGQEPVLYARTIAENIAYGLEEEFSQSDIEKAAKLANAHNFITKMPKGYETGTGEKGLQISGGQKQRIAIARALIRNPVVLILDEATSALDAESEHVVQQAIYDNVHGKTVIIIAHRLSTVEAADRIIFINEGEVAEQGKHEELISQGGLYSNLVKRQLNTLSNIPSRGNDEKVAFIEPSTSKLGSPPSPHGSFKSNESLSKYGSISSQHLFT